MPDPTPNPEQAQQREPTKAEAAAPSSVPATGRRQAFQDLKRQLTESDLANPGTQKLILDMLINAESERDDLKVYVAQYYDADKRAAILQEKLSSHRLNEVLFAVGVGIGCAIIGLAPTFWDPNTARGLICLIVGGVLVIGSALARAFYK